MADSNDKLTAPSPSGPRTPSPSTTARNRGGAGGAGSACTTSSVVVVAPEPEQGNSSGSGGGGGHLQGNGRATTLVAEGEADAAGGSPFATVRPVTVPTKPGAVATLDMDKGSDGAVTSHRRTQSTPDRGAPRVTQLADLKADYPSPAAEGEGAHPAEKGKQVARVPTATGNESATSESAEQEPQATAAASRGDWVTSEGINILRVSKEYMFMALRSAGFSADTLRQLGLSVDGTFMLSQHEPVERKIARRLNELTRHLDNQGYMDTIEETIKNFPIDYSSFSIIANGVIAYRGGKMSWTVVMTMFVFVMKLGKHFLEKGESIAHLFVWLSRFIIEKLLEWIMEIGGGFRSLLKQDGWTAYHYAAAAALVAGGAGLGYLLWRNR